MKHISRRSAFIFIIIIVTIAVDQISKVVVKDSIELRTVNDPGERIPLIGDALVMMNVENTGAFLGMGSELNDTLRIILLLILPVVVLGFVLRHILRDKSIDKGSLFAFSSIIGGGISNVFDRIAFGKVTDFLYIELSEKIHTGIFNIADLAVTTGMIILIIASFKKKKDLEKSRS